MDIYKLRLSMLADLLETVPEENFDMSTFFSKGITSYQPEGVDVNGFHKCGTSACALGWALSIPSFYDLVLPKAGGSLTYDWGDVGYDLFHLEHRTTEWNFLFHGGWRYRAPTAKDAASRIRYYVKTGKAVRGVIDADVIEDCGYVIMEVVRKELGQ